MSAPRPIAVLGGTGPEGFGLALRWAQAGETVTIGSRDPQRAQDAAGKITQRVGASAKISGSGTRQVAVSASSPSPIDSGSTSGRVPTVPDS